MPLEFVLIEKENVDKKWTPRVFHEDEQTYILKYPCEDDDESSHEYENCSPYFINLPPGSYLFEVWGAQGGLSGGKGGYSKGIVRLDEITPVYIYIGSKGSQFENKPGITPIVFNGGGSGSSASTSDSTRSAGSGGGGTDIRINADDFFNRIIVAGGGGGVSKANGRSNTEGGYGGGENGQDIEFIKEETKLYSKGGTQENSPNVETNMYAGSFGVGGSSVGIISTVSGGGGGWFGGSTSPRGSIIGGGGGSGYVLHSNSFRPLNYKLNNSKYYMKYWELKSGNEYFKKCEGPYYSPSSSVSSISSNMEQGHSGSGCARITVLTNLLCFFKTCIMKNNKFHLNILFFITINLNS